MIRDCYLNIGYFIFKYLYQFLLSKFLFYMPKVSWIHLNICCKNIAGDLQYYCTKKFPPKKLFNFRNANYLSSTVNQYSSESLWILIRLKEHNHNVESDQVSSHFDKILANFPEMFKWPGTLWKFYRDLIWLSLINNTQLYSL